MIIPINKNILIDAFKEKSAFQMADKKFAEKGTVLAIAADCPEVPYKVGDIVCFKSFKGERHEDDDKKETWLVPFDAITAIDNG